MSILIKNGKIVKLGDQGTGTFKADILIEGSRIKKIGKISTKELKEIKKLKTIDASGKFMIPGFIQTHVHLCQTLFRGQAEDMELLDWLAKKIWPLEASHTKSSIRRSAEIGLDELIASGTTTVVDMGTANHTEEIFEVAKEKGIRAFIGNAMMDSGDNLPEKLRENLDEIIKKSLKLIEKYHNSEDSRLNYILSPRFILSCSDDLFREVGNLSRDKNLLIQTHAAENAKENMAVVIAKGENEVHYFESLGILGEKMLLAHCVWLDFEDMDLVSKRKANVTHCPSTNLKLGSGIAKVPDMLERGINVGLGADGAPCNNSLNMFHEMKLSGLLQKFKKGVKALPAKTILEMATVHGAKSIRMEKELGTIEENKLADLVILNLDKPNSLPEIDDIYTRIVYSADSNNVETVIVNGGIIYKT